MKKFPVILIIIMLFLSTASIIYFLSGSSNLEDAVNKYENGNYSRSIKILNTLLKTSDYEKSEKIYYYRSMALNRLILELESEIEEELKLSTLNNTDRNRFERSKAEIEKELEEINKDLGSDLTLSIGTSKSNLVSKGKFYNEFISKYSGSNFVEDLDYHELVKIMKINPVRFFESVRRFYSKYPNSAYLPQIVSAIFDKFSDGLPSTPEKENFLKDIIVKFAIKYPTSQEVSQIFVSVGENVNLRNSPGLSGKPVGKTKDGEILLQIDKSMDTMQIGNNRDYWYKISTLRGQSGWIFGKFLKPFEIEKFAHETQNETWRMEENFQDWKDSTTPANWVHIEDSNKNSFGFIKDGEQKILSFQGNPNTSAGLYSRFRTGKQFKIQIYVNFISGNDTEILKVVNSGKSYSLGLSEKSAALNNRKIPSDTGNWHIYEIESDNSGYAKFSIDGELLAARIEAENNSKTKDGLYLINFRNATESKFSIKSLKIK